MRLPWGARPEQHRKRDAGSGDRDHLDPGGGAQQVVGERQRGELTAQVIVHVAVRDTHHLNDLCIDAFASRDEVANIETSLIFEHVWSATAPNYLDEP